MAGSDVRLVAVLKKTDVATGINPVWMENFKGDIVIDPKHEFYKQLYGGEEARADDLDKKMSSFYNPVWCCCFFIPFLATMKNNKELQTVIAATNRSEIAQNAGEEYNAAKQIIGGTYVLDANGDVLFAHRHWMMDYGMDKLAAFLKKDGSHSNSNKVVKAAEPAAEIEIKVIKPPQLVVERAAEPESDKAPAPAANADMQKMMMQQMQMMQTQMLNQEGGSNAALMQQQMKMLQMMQLQSMQASSQATASLKPPSKSDVQIARELKSPT